jgi:hypothetical protein
VNGTDSRRQMPFGQHAGLSYYELVTDHRDYARWLLKQSWLDAAIAAEIRNAIEDWREDNPPIPIMHRVDADDARR